MTPARLWLSIFITGFVVCACALLQSLLTTAPYGDLSRIGRISEDEFGWKIEPPILDPQLLDGASIDKADILVIGDSFSASHVWQSVLAVRGHSVATVYWSQLNEMLCSDFDEWLTHIGFRGKLVVIESVERFLNVRVTQTQKCIPLRHPMIAAVAPPSPPLEHVPSFELNWEAQLHSGWMTRKCTDAAIAGRIRMSCNNMPLARAVTEGCSLFSHRRCDMALFLADDVIRGPLTADAIASMQAFAATRSKTPVLWMVVPNKWTTYLDPAHSQGFVDALRQTDLGPDLFTFAQEEKLKMKDFYFPNDTHISTHGQLVLGARMLEAVKQKLGDSIREAESQ